MRDGDALGLGPGQDELDESLYWATLEGDIDRCRQLLTCGADPNAGRALVEGWSTPMLIASVGAGRLTILELLLRHGGDPQACGDDGIQPLHLAALHGDAARIALLVRHGADPDARNARCETPLHWSVFAPSDAAARLLLACGADPLASDCGGATPADWATLAGKPELAALILPEGHAPTARESAASTSSSVVVPLFPPR